eukprot:s2214_g5.t1
MIKSTSLEKEAGRVSVDPHNLSSPEAAQLNKGAGFWAWASLLEAALLGVVCASWVCSLQRSGRDKWHKVLRVRSSK